MKGASGPHLAFDPDAAPHHPDELRHDGEAEPGSPVLARCGSVGLREGFEDQAHLLCRDADPRVRDGHAEDEGIVPARLARDPHGDLAPLGELDRVPDEVHHDLAEPSGVAEHARRDLARHVGGELQPFAAGVDRERLQRVAQRVARAEGDRFELELSRLDLREVEDVVDDREQGVRRGLDRLDVLALLGREVGLEHELGHSQDPVHGRSDLVAHVGEELGLEARGLERAAGRAVDLLLGVDALGDVAGDPEADGRAAGRHERNGPRVHPPPRSAKPRDLELQ